MLARQIAICVTCVFFWGYLGPMCGLSLAGNPDAKLESSEALPTLREYREEVRRLLRTQAAASTRNDEIAATLPLMEIAQRLAIDPRLSTSPSLYALRRSVIARLRAIKRETEAEWRRERRDPRPASIKLDAHVLAQINQAAGRAPVANGNARNLGAVTVGPPDYAPQLITLLQRTISPQAWDVNGGASTIQYWRPGMALVIRAPGSVHDEVQPLLQQFRTP